MPTGTQTYADTSPEPRARSEPEISAYESCPGRAVFLEAGNTEGWISSDFTVDIVQ